MILYAVDDNADTLVEQHGQYRDNHALNQIKGSHAENNESSYASDCRMNGGSGSQDGVHASGTGEEAVRIERKQQERVQKASSHGHGNGTCDHTNDGRFLRLLHMVNDSGRKKERASDQEIGKVANVCGASAFDQELQ